MSWSFVTKLDWTQCLLYQLVFVGGKILYYGLFEIVVYLDVNDNLKQCLPARWNLFYPDVIFAKRKDDSKGETKKMGWTKTNIVVSHLHV